jgi:hypothetical protein
MNWNILGVVPESFELLILLVKDSYKFLYIDLFECLILADFFLQLIQSSSLVLLEILKAHFFSV